MGGGSETTNNSFQIRIYRFKADGYFTYHQV
jgi:hypothetical protein